MNGVNKVILVGTLGADPEVRYMQNGSAVASISLATSEKWRDKNTGEQRDKTEWHRVALFGKLAEVAGEYLKKGSQVYVKGKLQTRKWQDQSGRDRYTTEIVVQGYSGVMQMLGGKSQAGNKDAMHQPRAKQQQNQVSKVYQPGVMAQSQLQSVNQDEMNYFDDDMPF